MTDDVARGTGSGRFRSEAETPEAGDGKRLERRRPVASFARVVLGGGTAVADCLIKDISESEARLRFGEVPNLPDAFNLLILDGQKLVSAIKVWHRGIDMGVRFTGVPQHAPPVQA